ncbi:MAG: hypothetical protein CMM45_12465 [Rhodospirillaceae bacterium]|nr:hypothetical protein [Rhodospirillaceae bacterium]
MLRDNLNRRDFLGSFATTAGAAALGAASTVAAPRLANAANPPKGRISDKPIKMGWTSFTSGPGAALGKPMLQGFQLAMAEINAEGGFLGKRKIDVVYSNEAAGTGNNVKNFKRMKLQDDIDFFMGIVSSGNSLAMGPVAEELGVPTFFIDGCTDALFEKTIKTPKNVFRITNLVSTDAISCMIKAAKTWPEVKRISHIHPDFAFGRFEYLHARVAGEKLFGGSEVVSEGWPKLFETDFTPFITKALSAKPDMIVTSCWGPDYQAFYKQGLRFGLFDKVKVVANLAIATPPHMLANDHPDGVISGVHGNYHFTHPSAKQWPLNGQFVQRYYKRFKEYPNFESKGAYTGMYLLKAAIEKANLLVGGWPDREAIIAMLEGSVIAAPSGYVYIRPGDHQAMKDVPVGISKKIPDYPFPVWDPESVEIFPVQSITAPPDWPRPGEGHNDPSRAYNWIKTTWPTINT